MTAWRASGEGREGAKVRGWRFCSRHSQEVSGTVSASRVCGTDGMPSQCLGTDGPSGGAGPVLHICLSLQLSMWKWGLGAGWKQPHLVGLQRDLACGRTLRSARCGKVLCHLTPSIPAPTMALDMTA